MAKIQSSEEFLRKFKPNDQFWRVAFLGLRPVDVEGPLTIVEIQGEGDGAVISLRDNDGEKTVFSLPYLLCKHCAVFELDGEAWVWLEEWKKQAGRA